MCGMMMRQKLKEHCFRAQAKVLHIVREKNIQLYYEFIHNAPCQNNEIITFSNISGCNTIWEQTRLPSAHKRRRITSSY